jgi:hypothetical protein
MFEYLKIICKFYKNNKHSIRPICSLFIIIGGVYFLLKHNIRLKCITTYNTTEEAMLHILCPGLLFGSTNKWSLVLVPRQ